MSYMVSMALWAKPTVGFDVLRNFEDGGRIGDDKKGCRVIQSVSKSRKLWRRAWKHGGGSTSKETGDKTTNALYCWSRMRVSIEGSGALGCNV